MTESNACVDIDALLQPYQRFGVHLGLDRMQRLLVRLGQPQQQVPFVHVAGTNGKGSICAYLSAVLAAAGYRVGCYTSPHLQDWTERIAIDNRPISRPDLTAVLQRTIAAIDPDREPPTLFEVVTAAAWEYFARQNLDIAVIEVGLGGRLDATNVAVPEVAAIASISRDHWQRLGDSLSAIAREKAGILKPQRPAAIAPQSPEIAAVIEARARALDCPLCWSQPAAAIGVGRARYREVEYSLVLPGDVQLVNSAVAIDVLQLLQARGWDRISSAAIAQGLAAARWPGRLQWLDYRQRRWLVDGAHNLAAARALRRYADEIWQGRPKTWAIGLLATKDCDGILRTLLAPGDRLHLVPIPGHQYADPNALATIARYHCPQLSECQTHTDLTEAIVQIDRLAPQIHAIVTGSLYLVGYFSRLRNQLNKA